MAIEIRTGEEISHFLEYGYLLGIYTVMYIIKG